MPYMLVEEPQSGTTLKETFDVLDEVFGTEEFSEREAVDAIARAFSTDSQSATSAFRHLVTNGSISEI